MHADYTNLFSVTQNRNTTSAGNQIKSKEANCWYKWDTNGYEGLSEVVANRLAEFTNLAKFPIVKYFPCAKGNKVGCFSETYLTPGDSEQTLYRAMTRYYNTNLEGIYAICREYSDISFYGFVLDFTRDVIGVDIADWLALVLKFDWLILNTDRHFNNIVFVTHENSISLPLFDNGAAFASDLSQFPLECKFDIKDFSAKPFITSFSKQVAQAERFSSVKLEFMTNNVAIQLSDLSEYYDSRIISRVESLLKHQMYLLYPNVRLEVV